MTGPTRIVAWLTEGTWAATADATARLAAAVGATGEVEVTLLHVLDAQVGEALHGAYGGLLGRGTRHRDPAEAVSSLAEEASHELLDAAAARLGALSGSVIRVVRSGQVEREVVAGCAGAALLVCARDGDRTRLGPHSLGHQTRFVVDHAPCAVVLIWPDEVPELGSIPPPPEHPPPPPPH